MSLFTPDITRTGRRGILALLLLALALGLSCGGESTTDGTSGDPVSLIARVEVTPSTALLTELGEATQFTAQAFDAQGNPVVTDFTWTSSHPDQLAVDANGLVTALTLGSGSITAEAEGAQSNSATLMSATPVAGAQTVGDDQLVGLIEVVDPGAPFGVGFQFRMTLQGINSPSLGDIIVGTGETPLGGRVVAVEPVGADVTVTLEMIPLSEMFEQILLDEQISMANATIDVSEAAGEYYDMTKDASGQLIFTLKNEFQGASFTSEAPASKARDSGLRATRAPATCKESETKIGPACCNLGTGAPLTLSLAPEVVYTPGLDLIRKLKPDDASLQKIELRGLLKVEFKQSVVMSAQLEGKAVCSVQFASAQFPLPGYLGLVLGASVPVGLSFEAGGKIPLAEFGFEIIATSEANVGLGYSCPTSECEVVSDFSVTGDIKFAPKPGAASTARMETTVGGSVSAAVELGVSGSAVGSFLAISDIAIEGLNLVSLKAGPTFKGKHAGIEDQVLDTAFKSSHSASVDLVIEFLAQLEALNGFFAISLPLIPKITGTDPLGTGPVSVSALSREASFEEGDVVSFEVQLDPDTVNFADTYYNVEAVHIYRKPPAGELELVSTDLPEATGQTKFGSVADGNLDFSLSWTATEAGTVEGNFFAFVDTGAFCSGECDTDIGKFLGSLELQAVAPGIDNDTDDDGFADSRDNCPLEPNPLQKDTDKNGVGDACNTSEDHDGDEWADGFDNCPGIPNPDQADLDNDLFGDACDLDSDGDLVPNDLDAFPYDATETDDSDGDGVGDNTDNCPATANPNQEDTDSNGVGDACLTAWSVYEVGTFQSAELCGFLPGVGICCLEDETIVDAIRNTDVLPCGDDLPEASCRAGTAYSPIVLCSDFTGSVSGTLVPAIGSGIGPPYTVLTGGMALQSGLYLPATISVEAGGISQSNICPEGGYGCGSVGPVGPDTYCGGACLVDDVTEVSISALGVVTGWPAVRIWEGLTFDFFGPLLCPDGQGPFGTYNECRNNLYNHFASFVFSYGDFGTFDPRICLNLEEDIDGEPLYNAPCGPMSRLVSDRDLFVTGSGDVNGYGLWWLNCRWDVSYP